MGPECRLINYEQRSEAGHWTGTWVCWSGTLAQFFADDILPYMATRPSRVLAVLPITEREYESLTRRAEGPEMGSYCV